MVVEKLQMGILHQQIRQSQRMVDLLHLQVWKGAMNRLLKRRKAPVSRTYLFQLLYRFSDSDCARGITLLKVEFQS